MVTKKPGNQTSTDGGGGEPFVLNKHKFPWHKELLASELSPQAKVIGGWFAFHGLGKNGKLTATYRRIVNETRIPHRTTRYAIKELVAQYFLFCDVQPGNTANLYTFVPAFQRQEWLDEEADARQAEAEEQQRAERERQRQAFEEWCHVEESWLRDELVSLAACGGAPVHKAAAWADQVMADARLKIAIAHNGGRQLAAHPARVQLDGLDAERAAGAATEPT